MSASFAPWPQGQQFAAAEQFLAAGKNKNVRPVARNTRLRRIDEDTIALIFHSTAVVTYHRDTSMTIYGGGWNTQTTRRRIADYSPARIASQPGGTGKWIVGDTGERTPPRVQKCRTCKGQPRTMVDDLCSGPTHWAADGTRHPWCPGGTVTRNVGYVDADLVTHPATVSSTRCEHGREGGHPTVACEHGRWERHTTGEQHEVVCYRCKGEGVVDYGSKPVPILASAATPYRITPFGDFIDYANHTPGTDTLSTDVSPVTGMISGAAVVAKLRRALPGITTVVKHPVTSSADSSVSDVIISLNDGYGWSREQIADWLDTLDVDLRFPTPA